MYDLKDLCRNVNLDTVSIPALQAVAAEYGIYPDSIQESGGSILFLIRRTPGRALVILRPGPVYDAFHGEEIRTDQVKVCETSNKNSRILRSLVPYTAPVSHQGHPITIGLGDRLGLASPGHIRLIKEYPVFPILAQQSIRELNLTGRTYEEVLDAASWAVFQEGYREGFGADGDHLKTEDEVKMALSNGFTMITLDCSDYIDNAVSDMSDQAVRNAYLALDDEKRKQLSEGFLDRTFTLENGTKICFDEKTLMRIALIYGKAVEYTITLYSRLLAPLNNTIDFEMSIDETLTPTSPEAHFFVASLLTQGGVSITSLAPRFCGEFQKGIDYIGDQQQFSAEFAIHAAIAVHFGYKISVHSGSDKFSIFPIVGKLTKGLYHLKTAGTNWLEAIRIIALKDPSLYREIHQYALEHLEEARQYYHIGAQPERIGDISNLTDEQLPALMDQDDARQVIHITYGLVLNARNADGSCRFKDRMFTLWDSCEDAYAQVLKNHIGKHLTCLGIS